MRQYLRNWLTPPQFADKAQSVLAGQLFRILHAIIVLSVTFAIPFALFPTVLSSRFTIITATVVPIAVLLLELARRGWVRLASYSLIAILWIVVTAGAITAGGVRAPIFMGYLVIIVIASLLLGGRTVIATTGLSLLSGLGLAFAETNNLLPTSTVIYTPYSIFLIYAFFTLSVLVLQQLTWRTLRAALDNLQLELSERKWVENNLEKRAHEMFLLYQMGKALTGGENLYQALRAMVKELKHLMKVDAFYVGLYDATTHSISFPLYISGEQEVQIPPRNLTEQPGLTARVIQSRQTLYLPNVQLPEIRQQFQVVIIADSDISTYVGIPLINEMRILGVMSVQAREPNAYTEEQMRMLETLASQAAIAVEKYNLVGQLQRELVERKQMETALRQSEARLQTIIDQFPYDLWVCDADSRYIIISGTDKKTNRVRLAKLRLN